MNYFCIYFCLYPLQSMSVYWIWLILRRRAGEGLRRASGHAKETPRDSPQYHRLYFPQWCRGPQYCPSRLLLQRDTATPPLHLALLKDRSRKVTHIIFIFQEHISGLGGTRGVRLEAGRPRGREGTELRQDEQGWSEGMDWKSSKEGDAARLGLIVWGHLWGKEKPKKALPTSEFLLWWERR